MPREVAIQALQTACNLQQPRKLLDPGLDAPLQLQQLHRRVWEWLDRRNRAQQAMAWKPVQFQHRVGEEREEKHGEEGAQLHIDKKAALAGTAPALWLVPAESGRRRALPPHQPISAAALSRPAGVAPMTTRSYEMHRR